MPSDRHEALHLILGFCKDQGLESTYRSLCWEAQLDASVEELAPHVSLMRILLDWKRAFEARFQGTPRIIQPVQMKQEPVALQHISTPLPSQFDHNGIGTQPHLSGQQATYQMPGPLGPGSQEVANGSVQTIHYAPSNTAPLSQPVLGFRQPSMGQQQPFLVTQASGELHDQPSNSVRQAPLGGPMHSQSMSQHHRGHHEGMGHPTGLPPRPPGAVPSHSSSLYSPHDHLDQQDCSRDASPDWQPHDANDETGHSHRNGQWGAGPTNHAANNNNHNITVSARRTSSSGSLPPATKLKGGMEPINQETFLKVITSVGEGALASQLFDFRRPQRGSGSSARRSAILQLDDTQHDAMYALAGCDDVNFLISNVQSDVRIAMHKVFGIDKESFTVWFKNRGRNPSKTQYAANFGGATKNGGAHNKRARMSDVGNNTPSPE